MNPSDYAELYNNYAPSPAYYEAYGPSNEPSVPAYIPPRVNPYFPNPYGQGQVRTNAKVSPRYVRGYDPTQDRTIYEAYAEHIMKGADPRVTGSSKSKRARNVNLLNYTMGSPRSQTEKDFFL